MRKGLAMVAAWIGIVVLVGLDQLLKYWAVHVLQPIESMPFLHIGNLDILGLRYLENDGAVFGSFSGMRWILLSITTVMTAACIYILFRYRRKSKLMTVALTLVISGGIGNWIDRVFRDGLVVDYLEVRLFRFAIFNFADCCVVIGIALLLIFFFWIEPNLQKHEEIEESVHE